MPHKQSMYPLQLNGKTDDYQLNAIIAWLKCTKNIPITNIKKDWFVTLDPADYKITAVQPSLTEAETKNKIVRRPDIIIFDEDRKKKKIKLIIELDGSIHHTKPGAKKTARRNADYKFACIDFIVIDILDLKYLKKSWFDHLDEELKKIKEAHSTQNSTKIK